MQCCTFDKLKNSWDRGIAEVNPGQIVVGGEVMQDGRQYAFDYIANIKKYFKENGRQGNLIVELAIIFRKSS